MTGRGGKWAGDTAEKSSRRMAVWNVESLAFQDQEEDDAFAGSFFAAMTSRASPPALASTEEGPPPQTATAPATPPCATPATPPHRQGTSGAHVRARLSMLTTRTGLTIQLASTCISLLEPS